MEWTLLESRKETNTTKTLLFKPKTKIDFEPGQYFVFHDLVDGIEDCRAYSASSPPTQEHIEITVRLTNTPHFSKHLQELPKGYMIEVKGPYGDFALRGTPEEIVLISAGSGIVPLPSIMRYVLASALPTKIILLYSAKTSESIIFRNELNKLAQESKIQLLVTLTQEKGAYEGRINADLIKKAVNDVQKPEFFICGPPLMVKSMLALLAQLGINSKKVHSEGFA